MHGKYILKRISISLIVLFIVITLNFFLPRLMFSDPASPYYVGIPDDAYELRHLIRVEYGFDQPIFIQYLKYLHRIFTLNFGSSHIYKMPVFDVMFRRIPWSLVLSLTSMAISVFLGIIFGSLAAKKRGKWQDKALLKLSTVSTAIPTFWLALILVLVFGFMLPIFPYHGAMTSGYILKFNDLVFLIVNLIFILATIILYRVFKKTSFAIILLITGFMLSILFAVSFFDIIDIAYHSILPLIAICFGSTIGYSLMVRNMMIVTVNEDYILAARAKGLSERRVIFRHAFKNALLPLVTRLGMSIAGLLGGSVLIERIFSWPGMGQLLLEANNNGDFQLAQAIMLFFAIITIFSNLFIDIIYHKLDPRVSI